MAAGLTLYIGGVPVTEGMTLTYAEAQKAPQIDWPKQPGISYVVAMWDLDSPTPGFIHYLATGITTTNKGSRFISYMSPQPPSGTHRYVLEVHRLSHTDAFSAITKRVGNDIESALRSHPLLHRLTFMVKS